MDELEKRDVVLIAIAKDSKRRLQKMKNERSYTFQLIEDRAATISKLYNMILKEPADEHDQFQVGLPVPSKVLINKDGVIVWRYIGPKEDKPSMEIITEALDRYL